MDEPKVGIYVCDCGVNIAAAVNVAEVVRFAQRLPNVAVARENKCTSVRPWRGWPIRRRWKRVRSRSPRRRSSSVVHLPFHASWLNQVEIYFSILQRKALTPNDFPSPEAKAERILAFQEYYAQTATPFNWKFTRQDLERRLERMTDFGRKTYKGKV